MLFKQVLFDDFDLMLLSSLKEMKKKKIENISIKTCKLSQFIDTCCCLSFIWIFKSYFKLAELRPQRKIFSPGGEKMCRALLWLVSKVYKEQSSLAFFLNFLCFYPTEFIPSSEEIILNGERGCSLFELSKGIAIFASVYL